jgi:hypothetical protein
VLIELNLKSLIQIQKNSPSVLERSDYRRVNNMELDIREVTVLS